MTLPSKTAGGAKQAPVGTVWVLSTTVTSPTCGSAPKPTFATTPKLFAPNVLRPIVMGRAISQSSSVSMSTFDHAAGPTLESWSVTFSASTTGLTLIRALASLYPDSWDTTRLEKLVAHRRTLELQPPRV